ncbi:hypothetical protein GCM10023221_21070 [Luteimicrobium xylanilyticum]|uniref:hypothetical protein n=1 Tax=Luteimicrobium xylanilyticum TaxID=1133546 RepID=UPI000687053D|nr:hypothetical protein [Luteimicrobium xylanilyticum]
MEPDPRRGLGVEQALGALDKRRPRVPGRVRRVDDDVAAGERRRESVACGQVDGVVGVPGQRADVVPGGTEGGGDLAAERPGAGDDRDGRGAGAPEAGPRSAGGGVGDVHALPTMQRPSL